MPKRIPIAALKRVAKQYKLRRSILLAQDGERTHVVTVGKTVDDSAIAAELGNRLKKYLGWPDEFCHAVPARVAKDRIRPVSVSINLTHDKAKRYLAVAEELSVKHETLGADGKQGQYRFTAAPHVIFHFAQRCMEGSK